MSTATSTAIQTHYNNLFFRSRLEARWAVFFDVLGIRYEYEPEKFQCGDLRYIPDFFLPQIGSWNSEFGTFFEVKGTRPDDEGLRKAVELEKQVRASVAVAIGDIREPEIVLVDNFGNGNDIYHWQYRFVQCPFCGSFSLIYKQGEYYPCEEYAQFCSNRGVSEEFMYCGGLKTDLGYQPYWLVEWPSPAISIAVEVAASARFESPGFLNQIQDQIRVVQHLSERRVFCHPQLMGFITAHAASYKEITNGNH